ncbi:MAG: hypothetical protein HYV95_13270 [Opitutae bacterium]|nr:hypothetical protein [Opitutae bacterium]
MSLINEALKKAQRQRLEGGAPLPPPPPVDPAASAGPRVVKRDKPTDFRSQLLLLAGGGLALICALVVAGFFLLRSKSPEVPANPAPSVAQPVKAPPAPVATTTAPPAQAPATVTPPVTTSAIPPAAVSPTATTSPAPAVTLPTTTTPAVAAPATASIKPAVIPSQETPKPVEKLKPSPRMIAIIEALKVAGIRSAGAESKVLMNDRVYRLNDTIEHELNIRLTGVTTNSLTFEDGRGATYTRNF